MNVVEAFGTVAVVAMLAFYALEARAPCFVLLFASACAASAAYAVLIGSWPFAVVETLWSLVAVRRWRVASRLLKNAAERKRLCASCGYRPSDEGSRACALAPLGGRPHSAACD
mgnify:CR=1 FL=1